MGLTDPDSYVNGEYLFYMMGAVNMWKYGKEIWCNKQGRYITIVADMSSVSGAYKISICNIGVFGVEYKRTNAVPAEVEVNYRDT